MGHTNKKFILIIIFVMAFLFSGCSKDKVKTKDEITGQLTPTMVPEAKKNEDEIKKQAVNDNTVDNNSNKEDQPTKAAGEEEPTPNLQPAVASELMIYTINPDSAELETVTALIDDGSEITPELIVNTVVESMADQSIMVGIDSVTTKGDSVIVSFKKDQPPVSEDIGGGIEVSILDAIAQSLLDNLDDCKKVIYQVEGQAYSSGHMEFGIDEVYLEKK